MFMSIEFNDYQLEKTYKCKLRPETNTGIYKTNLFKMLIVFEMQRSETQGGKRIKLKILNTLRS